MKHILKTSHKISLLITLLLVTVGSVDNTTAEAAKKKGGPDPAAQAAAELKKTLDPLSEQLMKLMGKMEGRGLFTSAEAGKLVDIKYQLLDVMSQYPQNAEIAKPVYQAGTLFVQRESYNDAYELFNFLAQGFPTNPYGAKARGQIQLLEKKFGADYFAVEAAAPVPPDPAAAAAGTPGAPTTKEPAKK